MSGVFLFLTLLMSAVMFIIKPGESLLPKIKCWDCKLNGLGECVTNTMSTSCRRGEYCAKFSDKFSNPSDGMDRIEHKCIPREHVLKDEDALNECVEQKEDNYTGTRCICDKNDCNSGNDFVPTLKLTRAAGMNCSKYTPFRKNIPITTTICNKGFYCYKYLERVDGSGYQHIRRGCIHEKLASSIRVNINQCGEFEKDYKKYPFCICDLNNCNSGKFTSTDLVKPVKTPCPQSSNSVTNTFEQITLILIWILA